MHKKLVFQANKQRTIFVAFFAGSIVVLFGCSRGPAMGELSGRVTLDGAAVEKGSVRLSPINGDGPTGGGVIQDGTFQCRMPVAAYKVEFSAAKAPKHIPKGRNSDAEYTVLQLIPEKYNKKSELTWDIQPGVNEREFELSSH